MPSFLMKEIRIPAQLDHEERERKGTKPPRSLGGVLLRASYTALICALISFFLFTALSIAAFAVYAAMGNRTPDFANAYRYIGAPGAGLVFMSVWIYAFTAFRRQLGRRGAR